MTNQSETVGEARKEKGSFLDTFIKKLSAAVALIGGLIGLIAIIWGPIHPQVAGHWTLENRIIKSTDSAYIGKTVTYDIVLTQSGTSLIGSGTRMAVSGGPPLSTKARTHIEITSGSVTFTSIDATFQEQGTERLSTGSLHLQKMDGSWVGTFESDAASSSGPSSITRVTP